MKAQQITDLNLLKILIELKNNKWKIILSTIVAIILTQLFVKPKETTFISYADIVPINSLEENNFKFYNYYIFKIEKFLDSYNSYDLSYFNEDLISQSSGLNLKKIDKNVLLRLFVDTLKETIPETAQKIDFVKTKEFFDLNDYITGENILKNFYSIEKKELKNEFKIILKHNDIKELIEFNKIVEQNTNHSVKKKLIDEYLILKKQINNLIHHEMKIINGHKKLIKQNFLKNKEKIELLKEQSLIAKELNIKGNENIETSLKETDNQFQDSLKFDNEALLMNEYYLNGYEFIESEIDFLNVDDFYKFKNLETLRLERKRNSLELLQQSFKKNENILIELINDKSYNFIAASIDTQNIEFDKIDGNLNKKKLIIASGFIGFFLSIIYILITNSSFYVLLINFKKKRKR